MMTRHGAKSTALATMLLAWFICALLPAGAAEPGGATGRRRQDSAARAAKGAPAPDYTSFSHATAAHQRSCDACHLFPSPNWKEARAADAAFPDVTEYPRHASCIGCHRAQFFARERPAPKICSNCHVAVAPRQTARFPFPNPQGPFLASDKGKRFVSDWHVEFPHDKHEGLFGEGMEACATCHSQGDPGTEHSIPDGHAICVTCHNADAGLSPSLADCATCHKLVATPARAGA